MRHDLGEEILHSHAAVHDRSQFEVQFTYDVSAGNISQGKDFERYRIEAYYFFPKNMGITDLSFPRENFYRSLHGYIRFKTPELSDLALLDPLNRQSPLNMLSFHLKRLSMGQGTEEAHTAANEARLFGCVMSSLMKYQRNEVEALLAKAKERPMDLVRWRELDGLVCDNLSSVQALLGKYRALVRDYHAFSPRLPHSFLNQLRQVDEFLTYRHDEILSQLHFQLASVWETPERLERLNARVQAAAEEEVRHREQMGYIKLSPADDQALALYTYRSSALKKLVEQVLYLNVKTVQETNRWRNLAAMFGAALAAVVAGYSDRSIVWHLNQINLWLAVAMFAFVYVIKDRIKEVLREYVWSRVSRFFPDNKLLIHDPLKDLDIGRCSEKIRYVEKKQVPADVLTVRNINHTIDLDEERGETVIIYQNDVSLNARAILEEHTRRTDIKHILRFNVEELLVKMDDPTVRVQFFDAASQIFCRLRAPKVYHLNVVFRFTRWNDRNEKEEPHFLRIRVILDKNGIQRIDPVVDGGRLHELMAEKSGDTAAAKAAAIRRAVTSELNEQAS